MIIHQRSLVRVYIWSSLRFVVFLAEGHSLKMQQTKTMSKEWIRERERRRAKYFLQWTVSILMLVFYNIKCVAREREREERKILWIPIVRLILGEKCNMYGLSESVLHITPIDVCFHW